MRLIEGINDYAKQKISIALDDNTRVDLSLWYSETQKGWFYTFSYGNKTYGGRRIVNSPNMLRAFRNVLPFGLACSVSDGQEPVFLNDFSEERAKLYILPSAAAVQEVEDFINA
jgi:hypothetical protein